MAATKVLIVDDSALIRQMLEEMLSSDPMIEVVGTAADPYVAREKIKELHPDVLTLDIEMPRMDGLTFLKNLMRLHPLPVIMVSTLTESGADITFEALELGAVDFVTKPKINVKNTFEAYREEICGKVRMASRVSKSMLERRYQRYSQNQQTPAHKPQPIKPLAPVAEKRSLDDVLGQNKPVNRSFRATDKIIALGASTGGTEAIKEVLMGLPANAPAMVITQHIPAAFSLPFAKRMDTVTAMTVCQAEDGQAILPGHVYIAPGDQHLMVMREGTKYVCRLNDGPPVNRHKPSVDVMFRSVVQNVGPNAIGVLLTGMGNDGAQGMKELQGLKVPTIAQDEKTSVVWGMPGEAVKLGAADDILPLTSIAARIIALAAK
ncbi:MAG: chemotaxis response regulator protein-glutamate methylesterase [Thiotrichales bacterium]|nr:chemotaxis response regulator protein-glutamate methylesterase [Thiotrichales bacterium]